MLSLLEFGPIGVPKPPTLGEISRLLITRSRFSIGFDICSQERDQPWILLLGLIEAEILKIYDEAMRFLTGRGVDFSTAYVRENSVSVVRIAVKELAHQIQRERAAGRVIERESSAARINA